MKKTLSILCVLALSLALPTLAANSSGETTISSPGATNIPVTASYKEVGGNDPVYSVDIIWGSMDFTYQAQKGSWDPNTHRYTATSGGAWASPAEGANGLKSNQLKITNHSNRGIDYQLVYTPDEQYPNITGTLVDNDNYPAPSDSFIPILSAEGKPTDYGDLSVLYNLILNGTPPTGSSSIPIGTITVTIKSY